MSSSLRLSRDFCGLALVGNKRFATSVGLRGRGRSGQYRGTRRISDKILRCPRVSNAQRIFKNDESTAIATPDSRILGVQNSSLQSCSRKTVIGRFPLDRRRLCQILVRGYNRVKGGQRLPERLHVASGQGNEVDRALGLDVRGSFEIAEFVTHKVVNFRFAGVLGG